MSGFGSVMTCFTCFTCFTCTGGADRARGQGPRHHMPLGKQRLRGAEAEYGAQPQAMTLRYLAMPCFTWLKQTLARSHRQHPPLDYCVTQRHDMLYLAMTCFTSLKQTLERSHTGCCLPPPPRPPPPQKKLVAVTFRACVPYILA